MPSRIFYSIPSIAFMLVDTIAAATIAVLAAIARTCVALTDHELDLLTGENGFTVALILAVVTLWGNGVMNRKAEDKRRNAEEAAKEKRLIKQLDAEKERHEAQMRMQRENADRLLSITKASIQERGHTRTAIEAINSTMQHLTLEIKERPCHIHTKLLDKETMPKNG